DHVDGDEVGGTFTHHLVGDVDGPALRVVRFWLHLHSLACPVVSHDLIKSLRPSGGLKAVRLGPLSKALPPSHQGRSPRQPRPLLVHAWAEGGLRAFRPRHPSSKRKRTAEFPQEP